MRDPNSRYRRSRISDHLPTWEQVVMLTVLFLTWWLVDWIFPAQKLGKVIGVFASLASFAVIVWLSVLKGKKKKTRRNNRFQRRVDALKADGIPVTHQNMYDRTIRPDVPIDEQNTTGETGSS